MASYHRLLQHTKPRVESPAKVFAKLKSKVQREGLGAKEGTCTGKDPLCTVRENHGAGFKSPRSRAESTWMTDELKENQKLGSYRSEAQALTLSPISSPLKTFEYSYSDIRNKPVDERPPVTGIGHGCTPRKRAFLESTDAPRSLCLVNRPQIPTEPPQIRDVDGYMMTSRTPVKTQPVEKDSVRRVFEEECAPLDKLMFPAHMFSPRMNRLKKRKWELQGFSNVSSSTNEVGNEVINPPQERQTSSAFSEKDTHNNTHMEDLGDPREFCADRAEMNQFTHEATFTPPRSTAKKRCYVAEQNPMSPAKMFAYMKERESRTEQQDDHKVSSSMRDLFEGNFHQSRDTPPSTAHTMGEMEDIAFASVLESVVPVNRFRIELADSQSDTCHDLIPAVPSQPVLLEDPLVLNTPRIAIPKKREAVFKRNNWPQRTKFSSESVIYLKKWSLKSHGGLLVDGIHREENIPWSSNIVVDRVSNSVVKTASGRVYVLVGKMTFDVDSVFSNWLLKKFVNGFPPNWKALYEKFLSESRDKGTERNSQGRGIKAKTKSEPSTINVSVKRNRQKPFKTPDSCPPASSSSTKVSRSGRVIKPPLEYWRGGRVILDAHMNVTIHECYDTSICQPEVTTTVSARASQKPTRVFLPCSQGRKQCEEASVPLRRVKASLRTRNRAKVSPEEKPSNSPEPPVETLSSPEEWSGRTTRSRQRSLATERTLYVDTVPQKQSEPEKSSTRRSKKQTHDTTRPSVRASGNKRASPESPIVNGETSQHQSSDEEFCIRRKKRGKEAHSKRGGKVLNKLQVSQVFSSSSESPEKSEKELRKRTDEEFCIRRKKRGKEAHSKRGGKVLNKLQVSQVFSSSSESPEKSEKELRKRTQVAKNSDTNTHTKHKQSKCSKTSPPTKPLPKSTQSSKKHKANKGSTLTPQEQDKDKWTEAELMKLQEAVSYYPKHMAGYWAKVARMVGTRSEEECHNQHTSQGTFPTPAKRSKKPKKKKVEAPVTDHPVISARLRTLKRKQQVRQFLETMPREDVDDVFSSAYMQNKRFEMPSMCPSDDHDFALSDLEPETPKSTRIPEVKTPQCLHITPGMMGSPNRNNDDKYVFQLQKRMKKSQFNVCKQAPSSKSFTPTPSVKRTMRRCGNTENDTFVVWEMFPGNNGALSESGEEEDFYFSDND